MHTLRLKLKMDKNTAYIMEKRFRILAHISNQIRKHAKKLLSRLGNDKQYQQALDEYIRLKKLESDDKQVMADMKRLSKFIKNRAENPIRRSDNISCQAVGWGRMRVRLYRIVSAFFYFRFRFVYFLFGLSGFSIPCSLIYSSNVSMLAPPVVDRK